ncbi:heparin lyase I family protein [Antarcticirhabdus aurantiaca]|uniref:Heparin lyase I family protein n=1 Tax=Antarcticirhabdus aurantiaca TaxID=2606717 RepID=A0ACD4NWG1_9HYPH|nr:heparin lyase I family protein [Antarcticirhabdus aurantiaca]WAJ30972.1 heparin lyase I family protein [Jeongeuplla avenae]
MRPLRWLFAVAGSAFSWMAPALADDAVRTGNGFNYYVQEAAPDRHRRTSGGVERFVLKAGDCAWRWNDRLSEDCEEHRERVEVRSLTEDRVGEVVCYRFDLMLPADYPEMSPKQLLGQWHNGRDNTFRNRYERGVFEVGISYQGRLTHRVRVPFQKGRWNSFVYRFSWTRIGSAEVWLDGRKVANFQDVRLLPGRTKSVYFKYGIYRSDMDDYRGAAPTQSASYRNVARFTGLKCRGI